MVYISFTFWYPFNVTFTVSALKLECVRTPENIPVTGTNNLTITGVGAIVPLTFTNVAVPVCHVVPLSTDTWKCAGTLITILPRRLAPATVYVCATACDPTVCV